MELQLLSPVLLILVSSYIILQLIFKQRKSPQNNAKLPPSPPKLPVIGHLHLLSGGLPQHVLRELSQRFGHVIHLQLGEISWLVVSSREAAKQVLKEQDPTFAERADKIANKIMWYDNNDLVYSPYGSHWRQMRRIFVSELLSARNLRSFGLIRQDEMLRLVLSLQSSASAGQAVNLTEKTSAMTCSLICRAAFGSDVRDSEVLIGLVKKASTLATGFELADQFPSSKLLNLLSLNKYRLWGMRRRVDAILERIMEEHRLKKKKSGEFDGEDIIDVLFRMQKQKDNNNNLQVPITNNAIKGFIFDVFGAGIQSSSITINWAMVELMRNSAAMAKAQAEVREVLKGKRRSVDDLKYLKSVVKETLRLHPPIPLNLRQCREECEVDGYTIHKKTRIAVNVWSMGRDPMYWEEPEMFRPERFDDMGKDFMGNDMEFIPFGAGRRMCPAVNFGVANVEAPLAQLLYHFDWQLTKGMNGDDIDIDMAETESFFGFKKTPLLLLPTPYGYTP